MGTLSTNSVSIFVTTKCTLRCKLCSAGVPLYKNPKHVDINQIRTDIEKIFKIYDRVAQVDILGGEPMMHPDIALVVDALYPYIQQFDGLRIVTNGTILASDALLRAIKKFPHVSFLIDNYGAISKNASKLEKELSDNGIQFRENCYFGENQHCGGWVNMGDWNFKNYDHPALQSVYDACHQAHYTCLLAYNGRIYHCASAVVCHNLIIAEENDDESIDLGSKFDLEKAKTIAEKFGTKPITACQYCNGFDPENSPRFPAAEQVDSKGC